MKNIRECVVLRFDNGHLIGEVLWDETLDRAFFHPNARVMLDARTISYVRKIIDYVDRNHMPWYDRVTKHLNGLLLEPM